MCPDPARRDSPAVRFACWVLVLVAVCLGCEADPVAPPPTRPNLVVITLDTARADALTPYGADPRISPNLAALAAESALFENAYSETNVTNPSHLTIFTGLRAIEHGVHDNASPIPAEVETLPELLQNAGWRTSGFPAVPHVSDQLQWRGFDHLARPPSPRDARTITTLAVDWIRENADQPFFAWVHYYDAHAIYEPPASDARQLYQGDPEAGNGARITDHPYFTRGREQVPFIRTVAEWLGETRDPAYPVALYHGELRWIDRSLGPLLWALSDLGLDEQTIVLVIGDHGESLGEHGIFYSHRGVYEGQLRIPFILRVPGLGATRHAGIVTTLDVMPTLRELLGLDDGASGAGTSLVPLLDGGDDAILEQRTHVFENAHNLAVAVRSGRWKLVWPIVTDHWLLSGEPRLFDLDSDPQETHDVANQHPEIVEKLESHIAPWIELGARPSETTRAIDAQALEGLRALGYIEE